MPDGDDRPPLPGLAEAVEQGYNVVVLEHDETDPLSVSKMGGEMVGGLAKQLGAVTFVGVIAMPGRRPNTIDLCPFGSYTSDEMGNKGRDVHNGLMVGLTKMLNELAADIAGRSYEE